MHLRTALTLFCAAFAASTLSAGVVNTRIGGYASYWNADELGDGYGGGAKVSTQVFGFVVADGRAGYIQFDDFDSSVVPLEFSLNLKFPFFISPYAGVGAGYYLVDSNFPGSDDLTGYFGQVGAEFEISKIGIFAELRYHDLEKSFLDGPSVNLGLSWKF